MDDFQVMSLEFFPSQRREVVEGDQRRISSKNRESVRENNWLRLVQNQAAMDRATQVAIGGRSGSINDDQHIAPGTEQHFLGQTSTNMAETNSIPEASLVEAFDPPSVRSDQSKLPVPKRC